MVKRIILHWSAGGYYPSDFEKQFYHFLVDVEGKVHEGKFKPEDNDSCTDGKYAAHTGGGNTGSIGVCLCGMNNFKSKSNVGKYPIEKVQFEACMRFCAELCQKYNLGINSQTVLTHYEFGKANPNSTSHGKIDIIYLPPYSWVLQEDVGNFIRSKVRWYREKL